MQTCMCGLTEYLSYALSPPLSNARAHTHTYTHQIDSERVPTRSDHNGSLTEKQKPIFVVVDWPGRGCGLTYCAGKCLSSAFQLWQGCMLSPEHSAPNNIRSVYSRFVATAHGNITTPGHSLGGWREVNFYLRINTSLYLYPQRHLTV